MAVPREEDHVVLEDEDTVVILAPVHADETIYCPECNLNRLSKKKGKYGGDGSVERFIKHLLDCHKKEDGTPRFCVRYRCRVCLFVVPENSAVPKKAMNDHYVEVHPEHRQPTVT